MGVVVGSFALDERDARDFAAQARGISVLSAVKNDQSCIPFSSHHFFTRTTSLQYSQTPLEECWNKVKKGSIFLLYTGYRGVVYHCLKGSTLVEQKLPK